MLKTKKYILLLVALVGCMVCFPWRALYAGPLMLSSKLEQSQILMGKMTTMKVQLVTDRGRKGDFPEFAYIQDVMGILPICGDSVELRRPTPVDTVDLGSNRLQITYDIPVQAFDSGLYRLPPIAYVSGMDTVYSDTLTLKVVPVEGVTAETDIDPMTGIEDIQPQSWTDKIPDAIYNNWWWMLIVLVALVVTTVLLVKYLRNGKLKQLMTRPPKPVAPWTAALQKLQELKARKLVENGKEKEYYTDLTEILRVYLEDRFGINALEMTSQQILDTLAERGETGQSRDYMRSILDMADFVKFAKMKPLVDEAYESMDYACKFIEETTPKPETKAPGDNSADGQIVDDTHELAPE